MVSESYMVSERKHWTLYLENLCSLSSLTAIVMKCFEHIIFHQLMKHMKPHLDPYHFVYKNNRSTEDAALTLLYNAHAHLEKTGSFVQILFTDFSSAFSIIQPHLMASKLSKLNVNPRLILWIVNRSQTVCHQPALLSSCIVSTSSPQGTVLSPILFTLCTNDCTGTETPPIIKYSDASATEYLSNSDSVYFAEVERFSNWCMDNSFDLSVKKTKEMLNNFRKVSTVIPDLFTGGMKVERVSTNI